MAGSDDRYHVGGRDGQEWGIGDAGGLGGNGGLSAHGDGEEGDEAGGVGSVGLWLWLRWRWGWRLLLRLRMWLWLLGDEEREGGLWIGFGTFATFWSNRKKKRAGVV